jgi:ipoprotein LpqH
VKRALLVAVSGAALVIAGLSGCSSSNKSTSSSSESTSKSAAASETSSPSVSANAGSGNAKVTIDGQDKNVTGTVACAAMGGNVNIAIGEAMTGIAAVVGEGDTPAVTSVALGNVDGVSLAVGGGQGDATAEKSGNTYKITGHATGIDMANPTAPVTKPFTIEVTCP